MAWEVAGYTFSLAILLISGAAAALLWQLHRQLRRWDRQVARAAQQAEAAISAYMRLAEEATETAAQCKRAISGFSRLSEGARAVGEAAEITASAAADTALFWRDRLTSRASAPDTAPEWTGLFDYFAELGRQLISRMTEYPSAQDGIHPGTSADNRSGE